MFWPRLGRHSVEKPSYKVVSEENSKVPLSLFLFGGFANMVKQNKEFPFLVRQLGELVVSAGGFSTSGLLGSCCFLRVQFVAVQLETHTHTKMWTHV